jgi:hypothetical protein
MHQIHPAEEVPTTHHLRRSSNAIVSRVVNIDAIIGVSTRYVDGSIPVHCIEEDCTAAALCFVGDEGILV